MTILLEIEESKIMKTIVNTLSIAHDDVYIKIDDKGFRAQTQNEGASVLSDILLEKEVFSKFEITNPVILHINLLNFGNFIKLAKNDDKLIISYDNKSEQIELVLKSENITRKSTLRLLVDESSNEESGKSFAFMDILNRTFHSNATFDASLLMDVIKISAFGEDTANINHSIRGIKIKVEADNQASKAEAEIIYTDENSKNVEIFSGKTTTKSGFEVDIPDEHNADYDLEAFKALLKMIKPGENIVFSMFHNGPVRISSKIANGQGHMAVVITPMITREISD